MEGTCELDGLAMKPMTLIIVVVLMVGLLLASQAATDTLTSSEISQTGAIIERAGFAYLTGLRVFAAAVIWNRLEPTFNGYYEGIPLKDQLYILPTVKAVIALDPQFIDSYYVASWILARRGDTETAFDLAAQGVENNPDSGTLRASYAQLLFLFGDEEDLQEAVRQADTAVAEADWKDLAEQHDAYAIFGAVYRGAGLTAKSERMMHEIERIDAMMGGYSAPTTTHDHDDDGTSGQ